MQRLGEVVHGRADPAVDGTLAAVDEGGRGPGVRDGLEDLHREANGVLTRGLGAAGYAGVDSRLW